VDYTLRCVPDSWWREVILLEAGELSLREKEPVTRLIRAIAGLKEEPQPYHNLVLAAECLRDVGGNRVLGDLEGEVRRRLRQELETLPPKGWLASIQLRFQQGMTPQEFCQAARRRGRALAASGVRVTGRSPTASRNGSDSGRRVLDGDTRRGCSSANEQFGGRREWYDSETPQHKLALPAFSIARVPITNAQYLLFTQATGHTPPSGWEENRPPKAKKAIRSSM